MSQMRPQLADATEKSQQKTVLKMLRLLLLLRTPIIMTKKHVTAR